MLVAIKSILLLWCRYEKLTQCYLYSVQKEKLPVKGDLLISGLRTLHILLSSKEMASIFKKLKF